MSRIDIPREGFTLSALATGPEDAPVVLLSNSLGTDLEMWSPQRTALETSHRVIGYDTRGHGGSGTPPGPYSLDDLVGDTLAVLDFFEVDRAAMMGLSIGGMTGLGVALHAPDRVSRLICACARADNPQPFVQSWDDRMAIIDENGVAALWPKTSEVWLTPEFRAANPELLANLERTFKRTTNEGYKGCAEALKTLDYLRRLKDIRCPVRYIAGASDVGAPPAAMQEMAKATPGSDYAEIADAAHIANLNQAEDFTEAARKFLS